MTDPRRQIVIHDVIVFVEQSKEEPTLVSRTSSTVQTGQALTENTHFQECSHDVVGLYAHKGTMCNTDDRVPRRVIKSQYGGGALTLPGAAGGHPPAMFSVSSSLPIDEPQLDSWQVIVVWVDETHAWDSSEQDSPCDSQNRRRPMDIDNSLNILVHNVIQRGPVGPQGKEPLALLVLDHADPVGRYAVVQKKLLGPAGPKVKEPLALLPETSLFPQVYAPSPDVGLVASKVTPDISDGPREAHHDRQGSPTSPRLLQETQGCLFRMTSYDAESDGANFSPEHGVQLTDPRFMEYVGAPESSRLMSRSPEYWVHHMGVENALSVALQLQHHAGLELSNVQVLQQLMTSMCQTSSDVLLAVHGRQAFPSSALQQVIPSHRVCRASQYMMALGLWRPPVETVSRTPMSSVACNACTSCQTAVQGCLGETRSELTLLLKD